MQFIPKNDGITQSPCPTKLKHKKQGKSIYLVENQNKSVLVTRIISIFTLNTSGDVSLLLSFKFLFQQIPEVTCLSLPYLMYSFFQRLYPSIYELQPEILAVIKVHKFPIKLSNGKAAIPHLLKNLKAKSGKNYH